MTRALLPVLHLVTTSTTAAVLAYALVTTPKGQIIISGLGYPVLTLEFFLALIAVGVWAGRLGGTALRMLPLSFFAGIVVGLNIAAHHPVPAIEPLMNAVAQASPLVLGLVALLLLRPITVGVACLVGAAGMSHGYACATATGSMGELLSWAGSLTSAAALLGLGVVTGLASPRSPKSRSRSS